MPSYKLYYFNIMGRAETARILFALAGVKYEDIRIAQEDWPKFKAETPFGQMPVLEVDGVKYCQSAAIDKFLGQEFGITGKNNKENLVVEMIGQCYNDIGTKFPFMEQDPKVKEEKLKAFWEIADAGMKTVEKFLCRNNGGNEYFVSQLTTADIGTMLMLDFLEKQNPDFIKCIPKLDALRKRVRSHPKIAEWIKIRPVTEI